MARGGNNQSGDGRHVAGSKKSRSGSGGREGAGLHEMYSGLIHTSDSNQGDERGMFVDFFGAPGPPDQKNPVVSDANVYPGTQPTLLTKWNRGGNGSMGRGRKS